MAEINGLSDSTLADDDNTDRLMLLLTVLTRQVVELTDRVTELEFVKAQAEAKRQADDLAIEAWLCSACGLAVSVSNPPVGVVHTCRERGWKPLVVQASYEK